MLSPHRDGWPVLVSTLLFLIQVSVSDSQSECIPYQSTNTSLHCDTVFTECDYVLPPDNLGSLEESEKKLSEVFRRAEVNMTIADSCIDSFFSLYCYQVYTPCDQNSSGHYVATNQSLCHSNCEAIKGTACNLTEWVILESIVEATRENGTEIPALRHNCTNLPDNLDSCIMIGNAETDCSPDDSGGLSSAELIVIWAVAGTSVGLIILSVVVAMGYCYLRVKRPKQNNKATNGEEFEFVQTDRVESPDGAYNRNTLMMRSSVARDALVGANPPPPPRTGSKDIRKMTPKQRIKALEFPHGNICFLKDLGVISFGGTYLGEATGLRENEATTTVYIKSLGDRASSRMRQNFIAEMTWASGFSHPNVLSLLGVCNKESPRYIIYEYMEFGPLKDFLQSIDSAWFDLEQVLSDTVSTHASSNAPIIGVDDLTNISCQLANGMEYLSSLTFVHRDLAARNCQIGHGMRVKIANFGFSYDLHSEDYCLLSSLKSSMPLPLRWLAPETLHNGKFSPYTDVWSFGVLLWEVFSFGTRPYPDLSNAQVVLQVMNNLILPRPDNCPESVYEVMRRCWSKVPSERPWFGPLKKELSAVLDGFGLIDVRKFGRTSSNPRLLDHIS